MLWGELNWTFKIQEAISIGNSDGFLVVQILSARNQKEIILPPKHVSKRLKHRHPQVHNSPEIKGLSYFNEEEHVNPAEAVMQMLSRSECVYVQDVWGR